MDYKGDSVLKVRLKLYELHIYFHSSRRREGNLQSIDDIILTSPRPKNLETSKLIPRNPQYCKEHYANYLVWFILFSFDRAGDGNGRHRPI